MRKTWFRTLLLNFLCFYACQAKTCVVGMLGESVSIPCLYNGPEDLTTLNISFEWRRGSEVVYKAVWRGGHEERLEVDFNSRSTVSSLAQTGNFTLKLNDIRFPDAQNYSLYLKRLDRGANASICTVCLSVAAHFTPPVLMRTGGKEGEATRLVCQSQGGFPEPAVHWYIHHTQHPPADTVSTHTSTLPHSKLYNVTSILYTAIPRDTTVSCAIENHLLNETLTTISYDVGSIHSHGFVWILSVILCVIVTVLVLIALCYQKKWDRDRRREREDDSVCEETEMIMLDMDAMDGQLNID
ncbi:ICOS ligand-like isoform X1 [Astyanax mexicanus]|uniref:ICOS ligand-like isoform X1 n=1 Tax=Astyanax mexicanus TaxID=7994 RepID=A0A8T2M6C7_ASTMX|nr:ICOS ligand-like isoform X1 [Astyanax mexicanus]